MPKQAYDRTTRPNYTTKFKELTVKLNGGKASAKGKLAGAGGHVVMPEEIPPGYEPRT